MIQTVLAVLLWILRGVGILLGLVLLLLLLVLFCKTKLDLEYNDGQPRMRLRFLFLHFTLFPRKEKQKKEKIKKKPQEPSTAERTSNEISSAERKENRHSTKGAGDRTVASDEQKPNKVKEALKSFTFRDYLTVLQTVTQKFLSKFRCDLLILHAAVGGDDAMQIAMEYGRINALLYPVVGALSAGNALKKADVQITPDFAAEETRAEGRVVFSIRLFHTIPCVVELYKQLF